MKLLLLFVEIALIALASAEVAFQDLGGSTWKASGVKFPSSVIVELSDPEVPGCVHTDWMRGKNYTQDLYYRFNDDDLKWIAESDWTYTRTFEADAAIMNTYEHWLIFEGVDTIATIALNGKVLGKTHNMFLTYRFNVTSLLQPKFNMLEVSFQSAVSYANNQASMQPYEIPPSCPPDVQHGFCHVNLIRKEQCSFSWDWGPAFATQGLWKPVYVMSLNYATIVEATAAFDWEANNLEVDVQFLLVMFANRLPLYGDLSIRIDELNVNKHFSNIELPRSQNELTDKKFLVDFSNVTFERWWPNGYGDQKLYNISVSFNASRGNDHSSKSFLFGFRKVELIQEPIAGTEGLSFYFRINDLPIFAKGANWIPADAFQNRITIKTYENLLHSAKDAHMNMLRVWGGGIYEDQKFYETADKLGIMLWQDFMYACALYPASDDFLSNVTDEISHVIWKLKHHPSIVVWAGNNENEAALSTDWYNTTAHFDRYKKDYVKLYIDTIGTQVKSLDTSRPYVASSPSNGKESIAEGGLAKNPYDPNYGDVHYYNYNDDCLDWTKYPATRFASEYGFQSWPSFQTIDPVTLVEDWSIGSNWSDHRQHHATGNQEMLNQISMHFKLPNSSNTTQQFIDTIFMTQIMQGLCYKSQTEFYRRSRNESVRGAGHTMGALYWQLNDIWQAPTWSSTEYGGKWKVLHYFAAKFFSPLSLIVFDDDTVMNVYAASDLSFTVTGTLVITVRTWTSFNATGTFNQAVTIQPYHSAKLFQESVGYLLHYGGCPYKEICYISVHLKENSSVPINFFFPVPFKNIEQLSDPKLRIENVRKISDDQFQFTVKAANPALFVWLETIGISGRFSDNAFVMYQPSMEVVFYSWQPNVSLTLFNKSLTVRSLQDVEVYEKNDKGTTERPFKTTWLDDDKIKLTFAIIGVLFIAIASSQVVCLVMRLNKPTKRPRSIIHSSSNNSMTKRSPSNHSWASVTSDYPGGEENEGRSFLIRSKSGEGDSARKTEIRFYII